MDDLKGYVGFITNFNKMKQSQMMDCFAYYFIGYLKKDRFAIIDIHNCFVKLSLPPYSNVRKYLADNSVRATGNGIQKYIKKNNDYTLNSQFSDQLKRLVNIDTPKVVISKTLRSLLPNLIKQSERNYLEEAINTFEVEAYRAAIIMVWLLTIDHLYEYILDDPTRISSFVTSLRAANNKTNIRSKDDFGEIKESMFLITSKNAGIISHDVWKILDVKLGIRNSCAHPSTVSVGKGKAYDVIEDLVNNVLLKY
ncbi:MAG TPA: hypothetical protein VL443_13750 [Cyclobacteriaceae bacterium]|jgi:hypothetical protein|nr:hypothetical protein [Cyclobacteriaceae bacterium]